MKYCLYFNSFTRCYLHAQIRKEERPLLLKEQKDGHRWLRVLHQEPGEARGMQAEAGELPLVCTDSERSTRLLGRSNASQQ